MWEQITKLLLSIENSLRARGFTLSLLSLVQAQTVSHTENPTVQCIHVIYSGWRENYDDWLKQVIYLFFCFCPVLDYVIIILVACWCIMFYYYHSYKKWWLLKLVHLSYLVNRTHTIHNPPPQKAFLFLWYLTCCFGIVRAHRDEGCNVYRAQLHEDGVSLQLCQHHLFFTHLSPSFSLWLPPAGQIIISWIYYKVGWADFT